MSLTEQLMADVHAYGLAREKLGEARCDLDDIVTDMAGLDAVGYSEGEEHKDAVDEVAHWEAQALRYDDIVKASVQTLCEFFTGKDQTPEHDERTFLMTELPPVGFTQGYVERLALLEAEANKAEWIEALSSKAPPTQTCACPPSCCCRNQA